MAAAMVCPGCSAKVKADQAFCAKCGTALAIPELVLAEPAQGPTVEEPISRTPASQGSLEAVSEDPRLAAVRGIDMQSPAIAVDLAGRAPEPEAEPAPEPESGRTAEPEPEPEPEPAAETLHAPSAEPPPVAQTVSAPAFEPAGVAAASAFAPISASARWPEPQFTTEEPTPPEDRTPPPPAPARIPGGYLAPSATYRASAWAATPATPRYEETGIEGLEAGPASPSMSLSIGAVPVPARMGAIATPVSAPAATVTAIGFGAAPVAPTLVPSHAGVPAYPPHAFDVPSRPPTEEMARPAAVAFPAAPHPAPAFPAPAVPAPAFPAPGNIVASNGLPSILAAPSPLTPATGFAAPATLPVETASQPPPPWVPFAGHGEDPGAPAAVIPPNPPAPRIAAERRESKVELATFALATTGAILGLAAYFLPWTTSSAMGIGVTNLSSFTGAQWAFSMPAGWTLFLLSLAVLGAIVGSDYAQKRYPRVTPIVKPLTTVILPMIQAGLYLGVFLLYDSLPWGFGVGIEVLIVSAAVLIASACLTVFLPADNSRR